MAATLFLREPEELLDRGHPGRPWPSRLPGASRARGARWPGAGSRPPRRSRRMRLRTSSLMSEQLVDPRAPAVAGAAALFAPRAAVERAPRYRECPSASEVRGGRLVRHAARAGRCGAPAAGPRRPPARRTGDTARRPCPRAASTAPGASLVCSVENTRWPVSAAWMAISAVSWSRISPTMITSGSCRTMSGGRWRTSGRWWAAPGSG